MLMETPLLDNGSKDIDFAEIHAMIEKETASKYSHNQLKKQSLILVHKASVFDGQQMEVFLKQLEDQNIKIEKSSEVSKPCYLQIMLKFFLVNFKAQSRLDLDTTATLSTDLIKEIETYFGHNENIFAISPKAIVLEKRFEEIAMLNSAQTIPNSKENGMWMKDK